VLRTRDDRRIRYGAPIATIVVGVLFAAADTRSLGNDVSTVLIAAGLIWFMIVVGRDMGMGQTTGRSPRVPAAPPAEDESATDDPEPPDPDR
jgi:hypothetical protein